MQKRKTHLPKNLMRYTVRVTEPGLLVENLKFNTVIQSLTPTLQDYHKERLLRTRVKNFKSNQRATIELKLEHLL